jgi:hypothetical protein
VISVSSLVLIPCLRKASSQPWPPHTHIYFNRPSQLKVRFTNGTVLQWHPTAGEDLPTPNTNKIVVFPSFQSGFGLLGCNFFRRLLDHYQIELVHLNPNSILQIDIFVHLCEAFLAIPPNFPLFKNYFFLKYQPSTANRKVIGGIGLQTHPHAGFLDLPLKSSLWGWHRTSFYCKNH